MFFERIYERGLAQASYLIGCQATGEAIVIDPKRDIDAYLELAKRERLRITHITETHIHADYLSGSLELANATNAKVFLSDEGGSEWKYQFEHIGLKDGDIITVGNIKLKVVHTPGHTPEHISFILTDTPASPEPVMIFTGDFVFVGDVGRPDLLEKAAGIEGSMIDSAKQLFGSLKKFKSLPDHLQVWPGHGAGSACGKSLGAVPSSTIGYEKLSNWILKINDEETFVQSLLDGQPEPPKYFSMMKKLNKVGPKILGNVKLPSRLNINQIKEAITKKYQVVDARDKSSFALKHISGSLNISGNNAFSNWAGWILDYSVPLVLIASDEKIDALNKALIRIGMDNLIGYYNDVDSLEESGISIGAVNLLEASDLDIQNSNNVLIDVRSYTEFELGKIPGAINIHTGYLENNLDTIPKDKKVIVYCGSGDRSAIAASFLLKNGFKNVQNLNGGINKWIREGYKIEKPVKEVLVSSQ